MKVSVIIPVYNKAEYIERCLENILQQDFDDFEVICVDDGSTDGSGEICNQYAGKDHRIQIIHIENSGVTAARRKGVQLAKGKYIIFVDADDQLLPGAIKTLYTEIEKTQADEVIGRFSSQEGNESPVVFRGDVPDVSPLIVDIVSNRNLFPVIWGLICRKDLVEDCLDTPRQIVYGEDLMMQLKMLMKHPRVYFISDVVYLYNMGIPNNRKRTLEHEKRYDAILRKVLEPEWEKYHAAYMFHLIKQYEEFIVHGDYNVRKSYYNQVISAPLPQGVPMLRRMIWNCPPSLGRIVVWVYRKALKIMKRWKHSCV